MPHMPTKFGTKRVLQQIKSQTAQPVISWFTHLCIHSPAISFFWRGKYVFPMAITPAAVSAANPASLVFQPHRRRQVAVKTWLHLHVFLIVKHLH